MIGLSLVRNILTTTPQEGLDGSLGIGSDGSLPVSLVIKDSTKVTYIMLVAVPQSKVCARCLHLPTMLRTPKMRPLLDLMVK